MPAATASNPEPRPQDKPGPGGTCCRVAGSRARTVKASGSGAKGLGSGAPAGSQARVGAREPRRERPEAARGATYSAVPDAEAGRGQHGEKSLLGVRLNVERRLGRAPQRAEQPLGPTAQEIHGPRGAADAAAPGPVRHTQRPGAGRPPPRPPPAESAASAGIARGICPLAKPGRADAILSDEGTRALTGPSAVGGEGGGRVRTGRGREERGGPPWPRPFLGPHGRHHAASRGSDREGCGARAHTEDLSRPVPGHRHRRQPLSAF